MSRTSAPTSVFSRVEQLFPEASRRTVKNWMRAGRIHVNGVPVRDPRVPVVPEDRVSLEAATAWSVADFPSQLTLVYEDQDLLVVVKPAGLLTIATQSESQNTAYHLLWEYLQRRRPRARPFIVHRLDRPTRGLFVLATHPRAKTALQSQFRDRSAKRIYHALVEGTVQEDAGTLQCNLHTSAVHRTRVSAHGKPALSHYRVVERSAARTLLEVELVTGRRHQIRAQLAHIGHPIVGDREYGAAAESRAALALQATTLAFTHPTSDERLEFTYPWVGGTRGISAGTKKAEAYRVATTLEG